MTLSAPFLYHSGCHSPEAQSPLPQVQLINLLPTHPAMTGCCPAAKPHELSERILVPVAAEDPQGFEHLLHSEAAALLQGQACLPTHSPTEVGFSQPHKLLECPLHISSGLQHPH